MAENRIRVTLMRSAISCTEKQKANLVGLGLKKRHQTRDLEDTPAVRGMINVVKHMVQVEEAA
ncbi:MAG: 50S ribosomal protein L30 [Rhodospirillaceae bacterium]|jgi:large subunit ribosomal protein L30|nr:50S ribosomal protein L30 [Alphaproteobacteria bacterium]CAI8293913.1 MAG: 50S ribosomal protein L30 [Rhodospirillaceae bacterium]|tara:strand:- start:138 stop:326 length:189 start_codon:yes stop_codon:yes gene_type:complete